MPTTASSSSARPTRCPRYYRTIRALMLEYQMPSDRFSSPARCRTPTWRPTTATPSVYVSLSEHEGFCVPLVEAMAADVPVLAYGQPPCPRRWAARASVFAPKDLEHAAECWACSPSIKTSAAASSRGSRRPRRVRRPSDVPGARRPDCGSSHDPSTERPARRRAVKIAFIVQRYGTDILGGSEYHCRLIAERLADAAPGRGADDVRARLHHLEERVPRRDRSGAGRDGAALRRDARTRDIEPFNRFSDWIFHYPHT